MSGQATGWVLRNGPRPDDLDRNGKPYGVPRARSMRAVLLPIADAANRDGDHSHPGLDAVIEGSLYSRRQVARVVADLIAEGWAEIEEAGGGRGKATVYRVPLDRGNRATMASISERNGAMGDEKPCHPPAETVPYQEETVPSHAPDQPLRDANGLSTYPSNGTHTTEAAPPLVLVSDDGTVDRFDEFWKVYPSKRGKPAARRAFAAATKRAPAETIIAGARRYAADPNRSDSFTKHPQGWLNEDRWDDPPLPSRTGGPSPNAGIDTDRGGPTGLVDWRTS